jgi:hypothetical protein
VQLATSTHAKLGLGGPGFGRKIDRNFKMSTEPKTGSFDSDPDSDSDPDTDSIKMRIAGAAQTGSVDLLL